MPKGVPQKPHAGHFKPGNKASPGRKPGSQSFVDRANNILETTSVGEIIKSVQSLTLPKDKRLITAELRKRHKRTMGMASRDLMIYMRIAEAFTNGGAASMNQLLDRLIGKPTESIKVDQNVTSTTTVDDPGLSAIDEWIKETIASESAGKNPAALPA